MGVTRHISREELEAGLANIEDSPKDQGLLEGIVIRPGVDERRLVTTGELSPEGGVHGDRWVHGCWMSLPDGRPHPDVQVSIMNARTIALIARQKERWPLSGDNLFIDLDLSDSNLRCGRRLAIGTAVLEVTAVPHGPCGKFVERYGKAAAQFVQSRAGKRLHLRGIYAKIVTAGKVRVGDVVTKVA